jgi:hypothetical protein
MNVLSDETFISARVSRKHENLAIAYDDLCQSSHGRVDSDLTRPQTLYQNQSDVMLRSTGLSSALGLTQEISSILIMQASVPFVSFAREPAGPSMPCGDKTAALLRCTLKFDSPPLLAGCLGTFTLRATNRVKHARKPLEASSQQ